MAEHDGRLRRSTRPSCILHQRSEEVNANGGEQQSKPNPANDPAGQRRILARMVEDGCLDLRIRGLSYREIAKDIGISAAGVHKAVRRALAKVQGRLNESATAVLTLECERLDLMLQVVLDKALRGDLTAVAPALKIMERRARLLGLDAPTQVVSLMPGLREPTQPILEGVIELQALKEDHQVPAVRHVEASADECGQPRLTTASGSPLQLDDECY
jgi:hypothetical protein